MSDQDGETPVIRLLSAENVEMRNAVSSMVKAISQVDGKVDTAVSLLQRISDRQDRHEARVEIFEQRLFEVRSENAESIRAAEREFESRIKRSEDQTKVEFEDQTRELGRKIDTINTRTLTMGGGVAVLAFLAPFVLKFVFGV